MDNNTLLNLDIDSLSDTVSKDEFIDITKKIQRLARGLTINVNDLREGTKVRTNGHTYEFVNTQR